MIIVEQFRRRLAELGYPAGRMRRDVLELADHYEDLKLAAMEEGLSEPAAETRANELLGEPVALAEQLAAVLRNSSWWGRHPIIGFCLLPPLGILTILLLEMFCLYHIGSLYLSEQEMSILAEDDLVLNFVEAGIYYPAVALAATLFCWLARRSASGLRWTLAACAVCASHSYFFQLRIVPHVLSVGYYFPSGFRDLIATAIPLAVAAAVVVRQRRVERRLALLPAGKLI